MTEARAGRLPEYSLVVPNLNDKSGDEARDDRSRLRTAATVSTDEVLIAHIYNALRANEALWHSSMLVITYASHGGFYDHVPPPAAAPDGFVAPPADTGTDRPFLFDRLGVRVPAIVVSPYVARGTVDHTLYEHASIPATAAEIFLGNHRDQSTREKAVNTLGHLLVRRAPRVRSDTVAFDLED